MAYQPVDGPNVYGTISVGTTPVELKIGASALSERKVIVIQSLGSRIYLGYDNSVTVSNGMEMSKRQVLFLEVGEHVQVFAVASSGTIDVRIQELS